MGTESRNVRYDYLLIFFSLSIYLMALCDHMLPLMNETLIRVQLGGLKHIGEPLKIFGFIT